MFYISKTMRKFKKFKSNSESIEGREVIFFYDGDELKALWDEDTYTFYYDGKI